MANLKYSVESKPYIELKNKIKAPKFQRNFVWKKKARKELIKSIKNGLPIGSFLLQRLNNGDYNIIDGRQRFSTLLDYEVHRYNYVDEDDITEANIETLLNSIPSINSLLSRYSEQARNEIINKTKTVAIKQLKTKDVEKPDVCYEITAEIKKLVPNLSQADDKALNKSVDKFYDSIWQILNVSNIILPCIIFSEEATDDEIVATFININSKGTKLSKYDLYSAAWQNEIITVDDNEILNKVISKYKDSLETNQKIETQGFNEAEIWNTKKINIFEYAYALSKLIGEKCENKIYQIKDASEVDSLGFSILASILNVPTKDIGRLASNLVKSKLNYAVLKDKIIQCVQRIQTKLLWYCTTPDNKNLFSHSLNQLVSYIVTYFKAKFVIVDGQITTNPKKNRIIDFENNLPIWYLYDNIRGYWAGSGDSKLDNLVITDDIYNSRYFGIVSEDAFRSALYDWIKEENSDKNTSIKPETKLFINYLVKKSCSEPHNKMDFEHIIPQARLDALKTKHKNVNGISSPTNLTLIPAFDNRAKREKTYYELIASKDETALTYNKDYLIKYIYPEHNEIKFIEAQSDFTVENFEHFKKDRGNYLVNLFIKEYYNK